MAVDTEELELSLSPDAQTIEDLISERSGPGIIMMALPSRLLHLNRKAWELIREINHIGDAGVATGLLPPVLSEICAAIQKDLQVRTEAKDWEQFELRRVVANSKDPILFRVFRLPDKDGKKGSYILVIMEKIGGRKTAKIGLNGGNGHAKDQFHLTAREYEVCEHLTRG